jgi:hypothetical protein
VSSFHIARALLRQIYNTEVDLIPDLNAKTLIAWLHTETVFPGTDLRLLYKLGSA